MDKKTMSAPDVERLLPCPFCRRKPKFTNQSVNGLACFEVRCRVCGISFRCTTATDVCGLWNTRDLSSRPDSIPQADVAGRLAEALEELRDAHVRYDHHYDTEAPIEHRVMMRRAEAALALYRANRSGWIPVGERLPDGSLWKIDVKLRDGSVLIGGERDLALVRWCGLFFREDGPEIVAWRESEPTPPQEGQKI